MNEQLQYVILIVVQFLRYFLFAGIPFLIFYVLFSKKFSKNKLQARFAKRKDFIREILHSMQTILIIFSFSLLMLLSPLKEYTQIYYNFSDYPIWWMFASTLLLFVLHDAYFYWLHRVLHGSMFYKRVHLLHHKSANPSPLASFSFNFFEAVLESIPAPLFLLLIPFNPLVLIFYGIVSFVINVYGHLGYEIAPRWLRHSLLFEMLVTSTYHNLHHEKVNCNYGLYFRFWDKLMKTEHRDYVKIYDEIQERRFGKINSSKEGGPSGLRERLVTSNL